MPLYDQDGTSGSGYSPKPRLDLPSIPNDNSPVTHSELATILRRLKDWSQRLQFGREGFTVQGFLLDELPASTPETPITFSQIVEDSNGYAKTYKDPDLTYFQVPPGMGRPYCINYFFRFTHLVAETDTFTYTGAMQEWTAPSGIFEGIVDFAVSGAEGGTGTSSSTPGRGHVMEARLTGVATGEVFDIEVGGAGDGSINGGWPNGGDGDAVATGNSGGGGGRSSVRYDGDTLADALIVAGGGGGTGRKTIAPGSNGGDGGYPTGVRGDGFNDNLNPNSDQAQPGTQSAGGVGAFSSGGFPGNPGSFGQGGNAPDITNSFTFNGGGGGDGWYGGGSGAGVNSSGVNNGGGAGGSSYVSNQVTLVDSTGFNTGDGEVVVSYFTEDPVADSAVITRVYVAYAQYPNKNPYEEVRCVLMDQGASPHQGAVILPLGEGDRVWMTWENNEPEDVTVVALTFGMYAMGQ